MAITSTVALLSLVAAEVAVAVAPFDVLGLAEDDAAALRRSMEAYIEGERHDLALVPAARVDQALVDLGVSRDGMGACLREPPCASRVARRAGAERLLLGSAAGLGRTFVLRLALLDAERSVTEREVQGTVVGGISDLTVALPEQLDRLLPRPRAAWYRQWWVWTLVAVGAAAVTLAVALPLTLEQGPDLPSYPLP